METYTMKKIITLLIVITNILVINAQTTKSIIDKAIANMSVKNAYKYDFKSKERINGKEIEITMETKLIQSPHKIYLNNLAGPNKGKEILFVAGENKNRVLINTFINISLSPFSSLVRKGNHYTVLEVGFGRVNNILIGGRKRASKDSNFDEIFSQEGSVNLDGRPCYKIIITDANFHYKNYTIKNGESLYDVAMRLNVSEQLIIEKNSNVSGFGSAEDGMVIKTPSSYAKKSILYIDKENFHAVYQEMHDDKGLYEKYIFTNLSINPSFASDEFTEDFKSYNF